MVERNVRVGRETFTYNGTFAIGLPGFFYGVKLWSNAGFSLGVLGYEPEPVSDRKDLSSAEARYFMNCDPKKYHPSDEGWKAWLVIMQASTQKRIRSQEIVPPQTSLLRKLSEGTTEKALGARRGISQSANECFLLAHRYHMLGATRSLPDHRAGPFRPEAPRHKLRRSPCCVGRLCAVCPDL